VTDTGLPEGWGIVATDDGVDRLAADLAGSDAYALDTEFHAERRYYPRLALVQIAWDGGGAIVDPLSCDVGRLRPLFDSDAVLVGHALAADLPILERAVGRIPARLFDTQIAAGFAGLGTPSLASLVKQTIGVHLDKAAQLADWTARPLPPAVLAYAAEDVAHLLESRRVLEDRVAESGRGAWVAEATAEMAAAACRVDDDRQAWWRIKGAPRRIPRSRLGVACSVAAWRQATARQMDRPPRTVLSDLALASIVGAPPRDAADLLARRGAPASRFVKGILAAVRAGEEMDPDTVPRPDVSGVDGDLSAAVGIALALVAQRAHALGIHPPLLGARADVEDLVAGRPSRLDSGWRADAVGADLVRLLAGEVALRLDRGGRRVEFRPAEGPDGGSAGAPA